MKISRSILVKRLLLFVGLVVIITALYPKGMRFMYDYALDQPWRYEGVLQAPYDITVYKSAAQLSAERDSIERSKIAYYSLSDRNRLEVRNRLQEDYTKGKFPDAVTSSHISFLLGALDEVYRAGILASEEYEQLAQQDTSIIFVIGEDQVAKRRELSELFTNRLAYEKILENAPKSTDKALLQKMNLETYLGVNLTFDEKKTKQMHDARLASITEVIGHVQKGERIVGTGEIVTVEIYQELEGYKRAHESQGGSQLQQWGVILGQFFLVLLPLLTLFLYLFAFRPNFLQRSRDVLFLLAQVGVFVSLTYLLVPVEPVAVYMIPYSMVAMLVRIFMDSRTAFMTHTVTILISSLVVPAPLEFLLTQIIAGALVQVTLRSLSQRSDLILSSFTVYFSMLVMVLAFSLAGNGSLIGFHWPTLLHLGINFIFLMFTYVLVYIFERVFGYVSTISLVELSDINKPLLKQLSEVAPGTFQHSLNVSILATDAVDRIGGDVRLVRSGALYHDIGKMKNPTYFTENQGNTNPHDQLSYKESAQIIIRHVTDGVEMAERAQLPQVIIDFIRTHHGLGMTKYFYVQYKNENPDEVIDESLFHYPGPNPFTREQGILMLADAVEASSRSLKELTEQKIEEHVHKIVNGIVDEGLLKNTPLTFRDIETTKQVFIEKLRTMYHSRIEYPDLLSHKTSKGVAK